MLIKSPFFKTDKGIHTNSTYRDVKNAYSITRIEPTREHIVLVIDEINAEFLITKTELEEGLWNSKTNTVNPHKIPDDAQIENFILWWNN